MYDVILSFNYCSDIKEIDSFTGKLKYCWSMSSVLSCVLGRSEPVTVDIIFDTTREHRQNRRYFVKSDVAKVRNKKTQL